MHDDFWSLGNYLAENVLLSSILSKRPTDDNSKITRWAYHIKTQNCFLNICKTFLSKLSNIGKRRIETVQKKLLNFNLHDDRGNHENHIVKLSSEVKSLIHLHCESLPHAESHYTREDSKLKYFDSPDLTLDALYGLFTEYYASVTGNTETPLSKNTYFNHHVNFSFKLPKIDVCNVCSAFEVSQIDETDYKVLKDLVEKYNFIKNKMLNTKDVLHLEFDFAQNLSLPKLPINSQFFCRLLWLHILNVHVHYSPNSYMFYFLEGSLKKGSNTVCNLIQHVIEKELERNHFQKIFLYSDVDGGQNRSYLTVLFLSWLSVKYQTEIVHLYPVRGHTYSVCDRNFGIYCKKKKNEKKLKQLTNM